MYAGDREQAKALLFEYSEWLDSERLIIADAYGQGRASNTYRKLPGEDDRTHEQLVEDFLNETNSG